MLLGHRHVTEQDMAELEASGSAAGSILGLRPGALSVSHARASCRVAQGRPKASPACAPRGRPVASPVPASSVARLWAQGTGWARGGLLPGQRDPRRLQSETDLDSRLRCVVLGESLCCPSSQVLACKMRTFLCRREGDDAQHVAGTLKTRRVPAVLSSPGEGSGWARPGPVQQPKSHSRGRKPGPRGPWPSRGFAGSVD